MSKPADDFKYRITGAGRVDVVELPEDTFDAQAMTISTSGENTLHTPTTVRKKVRLYYICLSADASNTAPVTATVHFDNSPVGNYKMSLGPGSIWARNIGAGRKFVEGNEGDPLQVTLSTGQTVHVSFEYEEI